MPRPVVDAITGHIQREANWGGYELHDTADAGHAAYENVATVRRECPQHRGSRERHRRVLPALSSFELKPAM
jgi:hypothetical protein